MRHTDLLFFAIILIYFADAEDVVCTKKMKKVVTIEEGEFSSFKTQAEAKYRAKTKCQVTFKKGSSCPALNLSCSKFDLNSKNKKCRGGDKILVAAAGKKKKFCQNSAPNITTSGDIKLVFTTNKKIQATGAECRVECNGGNTTTSNNTTPLPTITTTTTTTTTNTTATTTNTTNITTTVDSLTTVSSSSNASYCTLDEGHTMCKYQGPSDSCSSKTIFRKLSAEAKTIILDKHNELRRRVAKGEETEGSPGPQPGAANMKKMVWNNELEEIAQRWADQCTFGHDSIRTKMDGTAVGQNAYIGYSSVQMEEEVLQADMAKPASSWYSEVTDPGFNSQNINPFVFTPGTGHYTQVVWADSEELGCAVVYFKDTSAPLDYNSLVVCNYAKAGNFLNSEMYQSGATCAACPPGYYCDEGLCAKQ